MVVFGTRPEAVKMASTTYNDAVAESKDRVVRMEQRLHSAEAAEQEAAQVYMFITVGPMKKLKKLSAGGGRSASLASVTASDFFICKTY